MKLNLSKIACFVFVGGLLMVSPAIGDYSYEFRLENPAYMTGTPGQRIDTVVQLFETATNGDIARLAPGDRLGGSGDGLFAFSLNLDFGSVSGVTPGSVIGSTADFNLDPLFAHFGGKSTEVVLKPTNIDFEGTEDFVTNDVDLQAGTTGTLVSALGNTSVYKINLATITFTAGAVGSTTQLTFSGNKRVGASSSFFADGFIIDSIATYRGSSLVVTAIPEPGSAAIIGTCFVAAILKRRRK